VSRETQIAADQRPPTRNTGQAIAAMQSAVTTKGGCFPDNSVEGQITRCKIEQQRRVPLGVAEPDGAEVVCLEISPRPSTSIGFQAFLATRAVLAGASRHAL
jgi:hypothetical protein